MTPPVVLLVIAVALSLLAFVPYNHDGADKDFAEGSRFGVGFAGLFVGIVGVGYIIAEHWRP